MLFNISGLGGGVIPNFDIVGSTSTPPSKNKNLITYPYDNGNTILNGVTFIPYPGGTIGVNGTATDQATFYLQTNNVIRLSAGTYTLSGAPSDATSNTYVIGVRYSYDGGKTYSYTTTSSSTTFTLTADAQVVVYIQVKSGVKATDLNFKPQIEKGSTATSFVKGAHAENTIWVNTDQPVVSWDFSASEPQRRSINKNLNIHPYDNGNTTLNGVTFTPYPGGTIGVSGTATDQATFYLQTNNVIRLSAGTYTISGAPTGATADTYVIGVRYSYDGGATHFHTTTPSSTTFTLTADAQVVVYIQVKSGVKATDLNFKPQIEKGSAATSFVKGDATGQVWISTGASSPIAFNALKKNNIQVYPMSVKQYVGGAWVDKTTKIYIGGSWKDFAASEFYIFKTGTGLMNGITGFTNATCNSTEIYCSEMSVSGSSGTKYVQTNEAVNVTNYKTAYFTGVSAGYNGNGNAGNTYLKLFVGSAELQIGHSSSSGTATLVNNKDFSIDISALTGDVKLGVLAYGNAQYSQKVENLRIGNIWLV